MIQYSIEVTLAWTIFYLIYRLFLKKETFFRANRWYLLHTLWLGATLPYLRHIPINWSSTDTIIYDSVHLVQMSTQVVVETVSAQPSTIDFSFVITVLYLLGVGITIGRLYLGLSKIAKLYKSGVKEKREGYTLVTTDVFHLPFSFFKYVFLHKSFLADDNLNEILSHEIKHIDDMHTIDILFMELFSVLFWWNPLVYLYRNEVKQNHEFIADAYASQSSTIKNYGQILLGHSSSGIELALTHQFFNSHLKKRITMLCTTKSARYKLGKYLVLIPCLLFFGILFSSNTLKSDADNQVPRMAVQTISSPDNLLDDIPGRKVLEKNFEDILALALNLQNQEGTKIAAEICINREGKIIYAEFLEEETTTQLTTEQKKIVLKAFYNCRYEASSSAPYEQCGQLTFEFQQLSFDSEDKEIVQDTTPIKTIQTPEVQVSERHYYQEGMADPLIVINDKISNSEYEHFFTESSIITVVALAPSESQKKYGSQAINGALEFKTKKIKSQRPNGKLEYIVENGKEAQVYKIVDEMPRFPGCEELDLSIKETEKCSQGKMLEFIYTNLSYPKEARLRGIEGMVVVQFIIKSDGKVSNFNIVRSVEGGCDKATLDLLSLMHNKVTWIPGKQNGKAVPVLYTLPVKFKLDKRDEENEAVNDSEGKVEESDCKGSVLFRDGQRVDVEGHYYQTAIADKIIMYNRDNLPEKYAQYKEYCYVMEMYSKESLFDKSKNTEKEPSLLLEDKKSRLKDNDCEGRVILLDGKQVDQAKYLGDLSDENVTIYERENLPIEYAQYQNYCYVAVVNDKATDSNIKVEVHSPEKTNITSLSDDCLDAVVIIDGQPTEAAVENGKIKGTHFEGITPDEILHITVYKKDAERELPAELIQYKDHCIVMVVKTKKGKSKSSDKSSEFSIDLPPPPPPLPPTALSEEELGNIVEENIEFTLYQNEPNPFNDNTLIAFVLPEAATAKLVVYDITGKVVVSKEGDYPKGYNKIELHRSELSTTGVLYYQLDSGSYTATKKMIFAQ